MADALRTSNSTTGTAPGVVTGASSDVRNDASELVDGRCSTRFAIFSECPHCGGPLHPEHAHFKCAGCGWRDSCCD